MEDIMKTENLVLEILEKKPVTRVDDFLLILEVYKSISHEKVNLNFEKVMKNHYAYGFPSFHTISRCRRKIFHKRPDLKPEHVTKVRNDLKQSFISYSRK